MRRPRVLLIAEACNPRWVSVPLVGWSHSQAIARVADVHLITQIRNRDAILDAGLVEGRDFTAIDSETVTRPIWKLAQLIRGSNSGQGWTTEMALSALSYPHFERLIWQQFGRKIQRGEFDVVHRLTPLSPTLPSSLAEKCRRAGVPFVLGPLNGGVPWPRGFDAERRKEKEWLSYVRDAHKLVPGYRATRRCANAILIGSRDTWRQMPRQFHEKCFYLPENAIDPARFAARRTHGASRPIRLIFVGRLVPYKGADMLIEAAAPLIRNGDATLNVIGDGPQMPQLKDFVQTHDLAGAVRLLGWIEHKSVQNYLAASDLLTFPSIREFGGGVVLEAMAVGCVPVVINYGGPGELVTPATGCVIPMGNRRQIIDRLGVLLGQLALNPGEIDAKSARAICRAHNQFSWDAKAAQVRTVYDWLLNPQIIAKPRWPMPVPDIFPEAMARA